MALVISPSNFHRSSQAWGAKTTLVARGKSLRKEFDTDLGSHLASEMTKKGIDLRLPSQIERILANGDAHRVVLDDGPTLAVGSVLFATGRQPPGGNLGLKAALSKLSNITPACDIDPCCYVPRKSISSNPSYSSLNKATCPVLL